MKIDNLAEINQAATLEASRALSKLINAEVTIEMVHLEVKNVSKLFQMIDPGEHVVVVEASVSVGTKGGAMCLMPLETALGLSELLLKRERGTIQAITGKAGGVLKEVANIVIGNYLREFARIMPGITMLHGQSRLSSGPFSTLRCTLLLPALLPYEERGLLIEVAFGFQHSIVKGYIVFLFEGVMWNEERV